MEKELYHNAVDTYYIDNFDMRQSLNLLVTSFSVFPYYVSQTPVTNYNPPAYHSFSEM